MRDYELVWMILVLFHDPGILKMGLISTGEKNILKHDLLESPGLIQRTTLRACFAFWNKLFGIFDKRKQEELKDSIKALSDHDKEAL